MAFRIVFVSDTFHHHQKGVADELFKLTEGSYCFIATAPLREERKQMGFGNDYPGYVLDISTNNEDIVSKAQKIINEADVVVLGSAPYKLLKSRLAENKLTFRYSERLWKHIIHYLKTPLYIVDNSRTKRCRLLCASAFAKNDYNTMGAFKGRCYKWGYFPEVKEAELPVKKDNQPIRMMWCSRFLDWKHPELPIFLARRLKDKNNSFVLEMYGSGQYLEQSKKLASRLGVNDNVLFMGNETNEEIIQEMRRSDIFLFTSDRSEGWGVVANESMGNGSVIVASDEIGSIPYLVNNGENGCTFNSPSRLSGFCRCGVKVDQRSLESLTAQVERLIKSKSERERLSKNAFVTMHEYWSPTVAAQNLLTLIDDIEHGRDSSITFGPCSKA